MMSASRIGVVIAALFFWALQAMSQKCGVQPDRCTMISFDQWAFPIEGEFRKWKPDAKQVEQAECILQNYLLKEGHLWSRTIDSAYSVEDFSTADGMIEIYWHYRQYSGAMNGKEEELVWINAFCNPSNGNWKHGWIWVLDGGDCYWQAVINLKTRKVEVFEVNGDA